VVQQTENPSSSSSETQGSRSEVLGGEAGKAPREFQVSRGGVAPKGVPAMMAAGVPPHMVDVGDAGFAEKHREKGNYKTKRRNLGGAETRRVITAPGGAGGPRGGFPTAVFRGEERRKTVRHPTSWLCWKKGDKRPKPDRPENKNCGTRLGGSTPLRKKSETRIIKRKTSEARHHPTTKSGEVPKMTKTAKRNEDTRGGSS